MFLRAASLIPCDNVSKQKAFSSSRSLTEQQWFPECSVCALRRHKEYNVLAPREEWQPGKVVCPEQENEGIPTKAGVCGKHWDSQAIKPFQDLPWALMLEPGSTLPLRSLLIMLMHQRMKILRYRRSITTICEYLLSTWSFGDSDRVIKCQIFYSSGRSRSKWNIHKCAMGYQIIVLSISFKLKHPPWGEEESSHDLPGSRISESYLHHKPQDFKK